MAYGFALRITGDASLADDVVQEAFVGAWRNAGRYATERGSVKTWLLAIVHHRAIDAIRRRRPTSELPEHEEAPPPSLTLPDVWSEVAGRLDREEILGRPGQTLSAVQREALELGYFSGLTQQEIAVRTNAPLGTVKSRMRLGLLQMRRAMLGLGPDIDRGGSGGRHERPDLRPGPRPGRRLRPGCPRSGPDPRRPRPPGECPIPIPRWTSSAASYRTWPSRSSRSSRRLELKGRIMAAIEAELRAGRRTDAAADRLISSPWRRLVGAPAGWPRRAVAESAMPVAPRQPAGRADRPGRRTWPASLAAALGGGDRGGRRDRRAGRLEPRPDQQLSSAQAQQAAVDGCWHIAQQPGGQAAILVPGADRRKPGRAGRDRSRRLVRPGDARSRRDERHRRSMRPG